MNQEMALVCLDKTLETSFEQLLSFHNQLQWLLCYKEEMSAAPAVELIL